MRSASSYRGARRKAAKAKGQDWDGFQRDYWGRRARALAKLEARALNLTPQQARTALGKMAERPRLDIQRISEIVPLPKQDGDK